MENLTHSLFGAVLYRSGFHRYVPASGLLWIIGANLPDIDVLVRVSGPLAYLHHHRGLVHAIPGILLLSLLLATGWWLWQQLRARWFLGGPTEDLPPPMVRWWRLWLASLLVIGTHPMLDALNNYGIRPLLPFNPHWFYGDLVFIVDPWLWLMLGGALYLQFEQPSYLPKIWLVLAIATSLVLVFSGRVALPAKLVWAGGLLLLILMRYWLVDRGSMVDPGLMNRGNNLAEVDLDQLDKITGSIVKSDIKSDAIIKSDKARRRDLSWPRLALVAMAGYLVFLLFMQARALQAAEPYLRAQAREPVQRFSVSPTAANPFNWEVFAESPHYFYFGILNLRGRAAPLQAIEVPRDDWAVKAALATPAGQTIAQFSRYLLADVESETNGTRVYFSDGRFSRNPRAHNFSNVEIFVPTPH